MAKKAILLSFRLNEPHKIDGGPEARLLDKVPTKFAKWKAKDFKEAGFRVVPGAVVRRSGLSRPRGADAVLRRSRPRVEFGTMIDTWATVGSCAQIGRNVHLSGGVGSAACSSRSRPTRWSSRRIASSAPAPKWPKG